MSDRPTFLARDAWVEQVVRQKALPADTKLRKGMPGAGPLARKAIDLENRVVALVVSTGAEDRSRDIVTQSGWDLADFRSIPTVLFGHDHWSFPIGKGLDASVMGDRLVCIAQFPTREESADADTAFKLIAGGYLKGVSAGFKPLEWNFDEERGGVNYLRQLLLECSMVPVPDNQECMALKSARAAGIDLAPMKRHAEKALDTQAAPDLHAWFATLYCLGGTTMKGKTIHLGKTLSTALEKAVTPETTREALVAQMAAKAAVDVAGMEAILKGEAAESPSLTALDSVAGVIGADVNEVVVAAAADVQPEAPAAPQKSAEEKPADPPVTSGAAADPAKPPETPAASADDATPKAFVQAIEKNTDVQRENLAVQREILAALKGKAAEAPAPPPAATKGATDDDDLDLSELTPEVMKAIARDAIKEVVAESMSEVTGRLPN